MYDLIIIGRGPAGISASLYTSRAGIKTLLIGMTSALSKSHMIDNYYGFGEGISGRDLLKQGEKQTLRFGTNIVEDEVIAVEYNFQGTYTVKTKGNEVYSSRSVLFATGAEKKKIHVKNIDKFDGKGVHYCTTCDGYFYRGKKVAVLGYNEYAFNEFEEMKNFTEDVTLLTNGNEPAGEVKGAVVNRKAIASVEGAEFLEKIIYTDGSEESFDGIFVAYGTASSADFARKLGILTRDSIIETDEEQRTNLEGVYAAGDCSSKVKQIAVAVGQGAVAGLKISQFIRNSGR
jgi:thioredoxin reductase (NADPH)